MVVLADRANIRRVGRAVFGERFDDKFNHLSGITKSQELMLMLDIDSQSSSASARRDHADCVRSHPLIITGKPPALPG